MAIIHFFPLYFRFNHNMLITFHSQLKNVFFFVYKQRDDVRDENKVNNRLNAQVTFDFITFLFSFVLFFYKILKEFIMSPYHHCVLIASAQSVHPCV